MTATFTVPVFVLTSDVDWAPDWCIDALANEASARGIRPVFFATGPNLALSRRLEDGGVEVGWHPNFRAGSTQGSSEREVIGYLRRAFPLAACWRAHGFIDSTNISNAMRDAGMEYDSNLNLHLHPSIQPLGHSSGLTRYPVFWEDDVHWTRKDPWDVEAILEACLQPGLKIFNVHPAAFALNVPNDSFYQSIKSRIPTLSEIEADRLRYRGTGTQTFVLALLDRLLHLGHRFHTLAELHAMSGEEADPQGRGRQLSAEEFERYSRGDASSRQYQLQQIYNERHPTDPYATSRDVNLRELEIEALATHLRPGRVLDLGCGNGYTLLSIAKGRCDCQMTGVDFAERLIGGARQLASQSALASAVEFVHGDALAYLRDSPDGRVDCVITERFLLNLPTPESQRAAIADIYRVLAAGGRFLMCEGSMEGFRGLNGIRTSVGLPAIEERSTDNASALRFEDEEIEGYCRRLGFALSAKLGFRDYFVVSRVVHPLLVAPEPARFTARLNALARQVQRELPFAPGIGSNVVWVLDKR